MLKQGCAKLKKLILLLLLIGAGYYGFHHYQASQSGALEPMFELPYVIVYGKTNCSWTQKCMQELRAEGIDPIFENIDEPDVKKEAFERVEAAGYPRNQVVIPIVDVNGHIVVAYQAEKIFAFYNEIED